MLGRVGVCIRYWNRTLEQEGAMVLDVPSHGIDIGSFAKHSLVREMITQPLA